jgi:hypothetical protein
MTRKPGLREMAAGVAWLREQGWVVDDITEEEELVARGVDGEGVHEIALPLGARVSLSRRDIASNRKATETASEAVIRGRRG